MEQMMGHLIATTVGLKAVIHKNQAKMDANLREIRAHQELLKEENESQDGLS
jgi:hypothetical protein